MSREPLAISLVKAGMTDESVAHYDWLEDLLLEA